MPIEVGYEFTEYTTTEGQGLVTLCAIVMNYADGAPRSFVINSTTSDGVAGMCYGVSVVMLQISF